MFEHEQAYRKDDFEKFLQAAITICGAGALGSNLAYHLVKQGYTKIKVLDKDRVEQHNIPTQLWSTRDVGVVKVRALQNIIHRDTGTLIEIIHKELTDSNASSLLKNSNLVVDVFDNWASRNAVGSACRELKIPCLHAGMSDDGFAETKWDEQYNPSSDATAEKSAPAEAPCNVALSRTLVMLTVAVTAEVIAQFIQSGAQINREITLRDLKLWDI